MNAVERAYREHRAALVKFITRRTGSVQSAEDIAQDAFVRLMQSRQIDDIRRFDAYLRVVASHLIHEHAHVRRERETVTFDSDLAERALERGEAPPVDAIVEAIDAEQRLTAVLSGLSILKASMVILRKRDGMSDEAIARVLGVSAHTVKKYLTVAIARCRADGEIEGRIASCALLRRQAG